MDPLSERCGVDPTSTPKVPVPRWNVNDQHKRRPDKRSSVFQCGVPRESKEIISRPVESYGEREGEGKERNTRRC